MPHIAESLVASTCEVPSMWTLHTPHTPARSVNTKKARPMVLRELDRLWSKGCQPSDIYHIFPDSTSGGAAGPTGTRTRTLRLTSFCAPFTPSAPDRGPWRGRTSRRHLVHRPTITQTNCYTGIRQEMTFPVDILRDTPDLSSLNNRHSTPCHP